MTYRELGFDALGTRTLLSVSRQSAQELRNEMAFSDISAKSVYVGSGDSVFKANTTGMWLGDAKFEDAPFSVDIHGNAVLQSAIIQAKSTTLTPDEDAGEVLKVTKADGTQVFVIDTTKGWVEIGEPQPDGNMDPNILLYITKESDSYVGVNMQNKSDGTLASCDFIIFNDLLNLDTQDYWELPDHGWLDMGVAGSNYADADYALIDANASYIWSADNFYLGCVDSSANIYFFMGDLDTKDSIKCSINADGVFFPVQATTAGAPSYVKGGLYFDTTLNKLRVGGASAWETVTSST